MDIHHKYHLTVQWTGNLGNGTFDYKSYKRSHIIYATHKPEILASSDLSFQGDKGRYNPEELFVASLSSCHMLWYLHLCAKEGVVVLHYTDHATGTLVETKEGGGYFTEVTLTPTIIVSDQSMVDRANSLHLQANKFCFIANSCNFPIHHHPTCKPEKL